VSPAQQVSFQDVLQLVELIKSSANFSELRIRWGELEVDVRRGSGGLLAAHERPVPASAALPPAVAPPAIKAPATRMANAPPASTSRPVASNPSRAGMSVVTAPMVGTIYHAAEPGAAPFVKVGQQVEAGDQLCIIEVMKLMNAVTAESGGTVSEILVGDGEAVEFGQHLYVIAPR